MDLASHYTNLFTESCEKISNDNYVIDTQIDDLNDNRLGITLLIRPTEEIKNNIQLFLNELKEVDASQYYYPNSDIHITVMSIISCYDGFDLNKITLQDYVAIINKCISGLNTSVINLQGITASPSAVMIQGFPSDASINDLRDNLRTAFKQTSLEQSIDKRYSLFTTHLTVVRFRKPINNKDLFLKTLHKYRDYNFGKFEIKNLELVHNDWYQRAEFVKLLSDFKI
ncbi:2'-5' RNA ligase family protein [Flavobacterium hydatis]|uniref:Mutarotase n=1 Tax=Flavobacterium hydatis TaxID=991 RepID=A0A086AS95_FLAHY|nr:mutarotase [Flavobacterium hydatis]KFF19559.1 mutarotase [Flavobacterium hydatis]OXA97671.1 mutarotase [Flavobacterium hydatis]